MKIGSKTIKKQRQIKTRKALREHRPPPSSSGVRETAEQRKCKTRYNLALRRYRPERRKDLICSTTFPEIFITIRLELLELSC